MRKTIPVLFCAMVIAFAVFIAAPAMAVEDQGSTCQISARTETKTKVNPVNPTNQAENVLTQHRIAINVTATADGLFANTSNLMNEETARVNARSTTANANFAVMTKIKDVPVNMVDSVVVPGEVGEFAEPPRLALVTKNVAAKWTTGNDVAGSTTDTAIVLKYLQNTGQNVPAAGHDYQFS